MGSLNSPESIHSLQFGNCILSIVTDCEGASLSVQASGFKNVGMSLTEYIYVIIYLFVIFLYTHHKYFVIRLNATLIQNKFYFNFAPFSFRSFIFHNIIIYHSFLKRLLCRKKNGQRKKYIRILACFCKHATNDDIQCLYQFLYGKTI